MTKIIRFAIAFGTAIIYMLAIPVAHSETSPQHTGCKREVTVQIDDAFTHWGVTSSYQIFIGESKVPHILYSTRSSIGRQDPHRSAVESSGLWVVPIASSVMESPKPTLLADLRLADLCLIKKSENQFAIFVTASGKRFVDEWALQAEVGALEIGPDVSNFKLTILEGFKTKLSGLIFGDWTSGRLREVK